MKVADGSMLVGGDAMMIPTGARVETSWSRVYASLLGVRERVKMAKYLLEVNYTLEGVKGVLAKGGTAREAAARAAAKSAGGSLECFYFAFGGTDVVTIADLPDNTAAAALALTVAGGGGATVRTTVLLTPDEIDAATKKKVKYTPPGG